MIEVSNATEVISMIELPEKTKNTDTTENKAASSEIVTSITISEKHDDSKEIKVLEQQPTSEVKSEAFSYLQGFESRMKEIQKEELERKIMIINAIHEYTTYSTAKFITKENLLILHENIDHFPVCINSFFLTLRFVYKSIIKFKIIIFWTVNRNLTVYGIFEILDKVSQDSCR